MKDFANIKEKLRLIVCPVEKREISWAEEHRQRQAHLAKELEKALAALGPHYVGSRERNKQLTDMRGYA